MSPAEREHWIAETFMRRRWSYQETLLWIAYRSPGAMADWLLGGAVDLSKDGAHMRAYVICASISDEPEVVEPRPDLALSRALLGGSVIATACRVDGALISGQPFTRDRAAMKADLWEDYQLWDAPAPLKDEIVAVPNDRLAGTPLRTGYFKGVMFDRESVTAAFPAPVAKQTVKGEATAQAELRLLAERHQGSGGPIPIFSHWGPDAEEKHNISGRGAKRVWDAVAKDFPALRSNKKPRPRRPS